MSSAEHALRLGIFARTFVRRDAAAVATAVAGHGFDLTQLNLSSTGLPTLPDLVEQPDYDSISTAFTAAGVEIWGLSATYNMIHPDPGKRRHDTDRAVAMVGHAGHIGISTVTLCTGTRDPDNMWKWHPDNASGAAWSDLRATLELLIPAARSAGVKLGIEPEGGNVVRDAAAAVRLLQELGADAETIGVVLDPANLVTPQTLDDQHRILTRAFTELGPATVCLHAKDVVAPGEYAAAGYGGLDYDLIMNLHSRLPHRVPVVIQDSTEADAGRTRQFLLDHAGE